MFKAHTPAKGNTEFQSLQTHLRQTAKLAQIFASSFGFGQNASLASAIAYQLTLWHDVGKYSDDFQAYLDKCYELSKINQKPEEKGPDHKAAGTYLASIHLDNHLPIIIQGHHGGLSGLVEATNWLDEKENSNLADIQSCLERAAIELPELEPATPLIFPDYIATFDSVYPDSSPLQSIFSFEFFIRMIYSCLVDADSLDTEAHMNAQQLERRFTRNVLTNQHWQAFAQYHARLDQKGSEKVSRVQADVYQQCLAAADNPQGFFRLTVPTGGGKTLSSLGFGIRHALHHNLERIVIAVPYLTITQQTTKVYREVFKTLQVDQNQPVVLEHYSSADAFQEGTHKNRSESTGSADLQTLWQRLAAENWDAPIIVTTTVQLFESMFARKRSRCAKLHNLARSVIILDEVQSLPAELLKPILDGLRELAEYYGCTIVFCTATQPEFNQITDIKIREIVANYAEHFNLLQRVRYDWRTDVSCEWEDVAQWMIEQPQQQALAIVNTKKDALALLGALEAAMKLQQLNVKPIHLSTLLCGAHRVKKLQQVHSLLENNEPCLLVSTQVVEAGVDLDFPLVLRALGPLSSIVQAAGRCNRKGKHDYGQVIIFRPHEGGEPFGAPKLGRQITEALYRRGNLDPNDPNTFSNYYKRFFAQINPDSQNIQTLRQSFEYREVAAKFKMIPDDTISVIVRYSSQKNVADHKVELEKIDILIDDLINERGSLRNILRQLQPYIVNLFRKKALVLQKQSHGGNPLIELIGDENSNIGLWHGKYDDIRGIDVPETMGLDLLVQ